jgi:hypothetical protein
MADDASENEEHGEISPESFSADRSESDPSQCQKGEENNKCFILGQCAAFTIRGERDMCLVKYRPLSKN